MISAHTENERAAMTMSELKPCKKCGWEHPREIRYGHLQGRPDTYRTTCPNCSYCTKEKLSMSEAVEAWHRRAGEEDKHGIETD